MPSTQVQTQPTQPIQTPAQTPKPDVKAMSEVLANLYTDYRTSDVAANKKFATVCRYYKEHPAITKAQLEVILQGTNLTEKSAQVEANRINNFRDDRNEFVLSEMEKGKLTINEARVLSTMKAVNQRDIDAKKARGETVPEDATQTSAGRKEFTPEKNCKNTLAKVVRYAIDGSLPDSDVHAWLDEAFKAVREDDIKKQQAKAEKEAQLKAESATTAPAPAPAPSDAVADLVHAAQPDEAVIVQAVQASPEAITKLAKAIKGKK